MWYKKKLKKCPSKVEGVERWRRMREDKLWAPDSLRSSNCSNFIFSPSDCPTHHSISMDRAGTCPDFLQGRVIIHVFGIITFIIFLINLIYIFLPVLSVGNLILWCPCFVFSRYDFLHWSMFSIISVTWNRKDISSHSILHANRA